MNYCGYGKKYLVQKGYYMRNLVINVDGFVHHIIINFTLQSFLFDYSYITKQLY